MMRRLMDLAPSPLAGEGWGEGGKAMLHPHPIENAKNTPGGMISKATLPTLLLIGSLLTALSLIHI